MALNRKIAILALDKQTTFGTLAATRKYGLGLRPGSSLMNAGMDQTYEELTISNRFPPSAIRNEFLWTVPFASRAWPRSVVMLLENALGLRVTTGAADPFLHTLTPADVPGYLTAAVRLDTEYHKIRDCRVDELVFTWDQAKPIEMTGRLVGTVATLYTTSGNPGTDDADQQSFYPAGGTFALDSDSTTPVTADITGGSIAIRQHLLPVRVSRQLEPIDVMVGWHEIEVTLRLIPTATTLWRSVITGSDAGSAISNAPIYGSFHTLWTITAGTRDLDMVSTRMAFQGNYPDPDPAGGPVELTLVGTVVKPAGDAITVLVHNQEAASNYAGS